MVPASVSVSREATRFIGLLSTTPRFATGGLGRFVPASLPVSDAPEVDVPLRCEDMEGAMRIDELREAVVRVFASLL